MLVDLDNIAGHALVDAEGKRHEDLPDLSDDRAFLPPDWADEYVLLGDGDAKHDRQFALWRKKLTRGARRAMAARPDRRAFIAMAERGFDFNDMARVER